MHGQPDSCSTEGVTDGQAASPVIEFVHVDGSGLLLQSHGILGELVAVHGLDIGEDLSGKGFMIFQDVDVAEVEPSLG